VLGGGLARAVQTVGVTLFSSPVPIPSATTRPPSDVAAHQECGVITLRLCPSNPAAAAPADPGTVLRFQASERHLHWAIAIPFKVCYVTALILVAVYNPDPSRPFRQLVSWIHRGSGVCLAVLPLLTIVWHRRDFGLHLENLRRAWRWTPGDLKWLVLMGPATFSRRVSLPHQGKFNAAEKINFMVLTITYPMYVATGLTIWFLGPAFVSWLIHFTMAMAATPLILGHVFMATINPDTRVGLQGMFSGLVDRQWARHHYRLWFDERHGPGAQVPVPPPAVAPLRDDPVGGAGPAADPSAPRPRPAIPGRPANPSFAS
jgi:formate dehydrogenase subunit gamma